MSQLLHPIKLKILFTFVNKDIVILKILFTLEKEQDLVCFVNKDKRNRNYRHLLKKYQDIIKSC